MYENTKIIAEIILFVIIEKIKFSIFIFCSISIDINSIVKLDTKYNNNKRIFTIFLILKIDNAVIIISATNVAKKPPAAPNLGIRIIFRKKLTIAPIATIVIKGFILLAPMKYWPEIIVEMAIKNIIGEK